MDARHEHSAIQDSPSERIHSLSGIISNNPYQTLFLEETRQCSENGSPGAVLCLVEDVTPEEDERWHICLRKYFFVFFVFCSPNLQSFSSCLCRRINL